MTKLKMQYVCQEGGHILVRWVGKCPECEAWNSFEKEISQKKDKNLQIKGIGPLRIYEIRSECYNKFHTRFPEFNRVMGGGVTAGSVTLVGGEPGVGKSTLLMSVCNEVANLDSNATVLYVSGEESAFQIASRCKRLGIRCENLLILNE